MSAINAGSVQRLWNRPLLNMYCVDHIVSGLFNVTHTANQMPTPSHITRATGEEARTDLEAAVTLKFMIFPTYMCSPSLRIDFFLPTFFVPEVKRFVPSEHGKKKTKHVCREKRQPTYSLSEDSPKPDLGADSLSSSSFSPNSSPEALSQLDKVAARFCFRQLQGIKACRR